MTSKNILRVINCAAVVLLAFYVAHADTSTKAELKETRIKFTDGSEIKVDDAWESEQGVWYRLGGISHLVERARVKKIDKSAKPASTQVASIVETADSQAEKTDGPVWI